MYTTCKKQKLRFAWIFFTPTDYILVYCISDGPKVLLVEITVSALAMPTETENRYAL